MSERIKRFEELLKCNKTIEGFSEAIEKDKILVKKIIAIFNDPAVDETCLVDATYSMRSSSCTSECYVLEAKHKNGGLTNKWIPKYLLDSCIFEDKCLTDIQQSINKLETDVSTLEERIGILELKKQLLRQW